MTRGHDSLTPRGVTRKGSNKEVKVVYATRFVVTLALVALMAFAVQRLLAIRRVS